MVGVVVLAVAAISARSVALGGFGLHSLIGIGASTVGDLGAFGFVRGASAHRARVVVGSPDLYPFGLSRMRRGQAVPHDAAVKHLDSPVRHLRHRRVVRHKHDRRTALGS